MRLPATVAFHFSISRSGACSSSCNRGPEIQPGCRDKRQGNENGFVMYLLTYYQVLKGRKVLKVRVCAFLKFYAT